jgi:hypothetical protein
MMQDRRAFIAVTPDRIDAEHPSRRAPGTRPG